MNVTFPCGRLQYGHTHLLCSNQDKITLLVLYASLISMGDKETHYVELSMWDWWSAAGINDSSHAPLSPVLYSLTTNRHHLLCVLVLLL